MEKRVLAFLIDYGIICILSAVLSLVAMLLQDQSQVITGILTGIVLLLDFVYIFKDVVGGQSIGKRFEKIKVVGKDGNDTDLIRLIARNITLVIWPVEAILLILGRERIGDKLAKTKVIEL